MQQFLIRNLPAGTKAALQARAKQNHRSVGQKHVALSRNCWARLGADVDFKPERLGLSAGSAEL